MSNKKAIEILKEIGENIMILNLEIVAANAFNSEYKFFPEFINPEYLLYF